VNNTLDVTKITIFASEEEKSLKNEMRGKIMER